VLVVPVALVVPVKSPVSVRDRKKGSVPLIVPVIEFVVLRGAGLRGGRPAERLRLEIMGGLVVAAIRLGVGVLVVASLGMLFTVSWLLSAPCLVLVGLWPVTTPSCVPEPGSRSDAASTTGCRFSRLLPSSTSETEK